jgi:hypothetical protein
VLRWYQGNGWVSKSAMNFIFSDFLTVILNTLNPLSKKSELAELSCGDARKALEERDS